MKYDLRKDEVAFPALPEKEGATTSKPPVPPPAAPPLSRLAELGNRYEPEVFELVRNSLDEGQSEAAIVATLKSNDFTSDEAVEVVRAVAEDRRRVGVRRRPIRSPSRKVINETEDDYEKPRFPSPFAPSSDKQAAAVRSMIIGMLLLLGGVILTLATNGALIFYGAVIWGGAKFLRGLISWIVLSLIQR